MRDAKWLEDKLQFLLKAYFSDVPVSNPIEIKWGREAKFRFGSIKLESHKSIRGIKSLRGLIRAVKDDTPKKSLITITSMFRDEAIPAEVVEHTIAHELCHYTHGFSSENKRLFRHPHHGGVVDAELRRRGARHLIVGYKTWLRGYRKEILERRVRD